MHDLPITPSTPPRIVSLTGAAYPSARIDSVDAANGIATFAYLDANGAQVDSGGSLARFAPLAPLPPAPDSKPGDAPTYPEVPDSTLADAIANPAPEPVAVPESVTRRQLKEQLIRMDRIHEVEAAVSAIPGTPGRIARNWWAEATQFERAHPLVSQLGASLGLTEAEIDAAFVAAAQL